MKSNQDYNTEMNIIRLGACTDRSVVHERTQRTCRGDSGDGFVADSSREILQIKKMVESYR